MLVTLVALTAVVGQDPVRDWAEVVASDTSPETRVARAAQAAFELDRLRQLPSGGGGSGRCDERIGRYCYWYEKGDTSLPAEPESIRRARARLLETLDVVRRARPTSDWINGQQVRYLVEHGDAERAAAVARDCSGTLWWCQALAGFAFHAGERFREADSAFGLALRGMPRALFCRWTDWSKLLEGRLYDRYHPLDCAGRAALADTLFALAQPLLTRPGNDLETELLSRRVKSALFAGSKSPDPWSRDMEEVGLRYGWPTRWSLADYGYSTLERPNVIGHDRSPAYAFFPIPAADSGDEAWRWELEPDRPRSRYAPTYAGSFEAADRFQIARFPRGDSTAVVAALDLSDDPLFRQHPTGYGVAVASEIGGRPTVMRIDSADRVSPMQVMVPGEPVLVSIEAWTLRDRRVARVRRVLEPLDRSGGLALSTPLLFTAGNALPLSLEEASRRALTSTRFSRQEPVGVYWETSGIEADSIDVSVSLVPVRRGLLGRIAEGLAVVKRRAPLRLQWSAPAERRAAVGRAVELDLQRQKPGRYRLVLEVTGRRGVTAATDVSLELLP